jgi:hypothetical protein
MEYFVESGLGRYLLTVEPHEHALPDERAAGSHISTGGKVYLLQ